MVSDTDLARGEITSSRPATVQTRAARPSRKKKLLLWFLLLGAVIACVCLGGPWVAAKAPSVLGFLRNDNITVTGIMYDADSPSTVINGKVFREGDTVAGYEVVKIRRTEVELEKKGKTFKKHVVSE
jgi:hypothetical protein